MEYPFTTRTFEHTADLGIEVTAKDPESLFAGAALALAQQIAGGPLPEAHAVREVEADGYDSESLLVRWLTEWVAFMDTDGILPVSFEALRVDADRVVARAKTAELAELDGSPTLAVKAVTYHGIEIRLEPGDCLARFVVDI